MLSCIIYLSEKLYNRLLEIARASSMSVDELIVEVLEKALGVRLDPVERAEFYLKLSEKHLTEAKEFLKRGDYVQVSEKGWDAAAEVVKALAAKEGRELRSHGELHREVIRLVTATGDDEIRHLWLSATALHQNFYENWLPPEIVEKSIEDVKKLIEKLKKFLQLGIDKDIQPTTLTRTPERG